MPLPRRRGSVLLAVLIAFVVFTLAYLAMASAQVSHAKRITADYAKLQAIYAAESAVYATLRNNATPNPAASTLWTEGGNAAGFTATFETGTGKPRWVKGTGTVKWGGETYTATVRGYQVEDGVQLWDYDR